MDIKKPFWEGAQLPSTEIRHSIPRNGEPPSRSDEVTKERKSQNGFLSLWERSDNLSTDAPATRLGRSGQSDMDQNSISKTKNLSLRGRGECLSNIVNEPHVQRKNNLIKPETLRRGWLKNGNPPGDLKQVPRCQALSKRTKQPCRQPAMINGKCRLHGGKATGPKTPQGLARSRKANWKHGEYSTETKALAQKLREEFKFYMSVLKQMQDISE